MKILSKINKLVKWTGFVPELLFWMWFILGWVSVLSGDSIYPVDLAVLISGILLVIKYATDSYSSVDEDGE